MDSDYTDAQVPSTEPRLPQELERIIFEITAREDRDRTLPVLRQVARRVRDWLDSVVYDTVILKDASFYKSSKSPLHHPPRFPSGPLALHVRNLVVAFEFSDCVPSEPKWEELLPQCHNLLDFAIWTSYTPKLLPLLTSIIRSPLRTVKPSGLLRLSMSLTHFFPGNLVDFNHELFNHLTHFEVLDRPTDVVNHWKEGNNYGCISKLRYLSFAELSPIITGVLKKCLERCKLLEVLVLVEDRPVAHEIAAELLKTKRRVINADRTTKKVREDRVVAYRWHYTPCSSWTEDWYNGAVCGGTSRGESAWIGSERIIQKRRQRRRQRSGLEATSWDSMIDSGADVSLGEWLSVLNMY